MTLNTLQDKGVFQSNYEFRLTERKAQVAKIIEKHSSAKFGHRNASIAEIRLNSIKNKLEVTFLHS